MSVAKDHTMAALVEDNDLMQALGPSSLSGPDELDALKNFLQTERHHLFAYMDGILQRASDAGISNRAARYAVMRLSAQALGTSIATSIPEAAHVSLVLNHLVAVCVRAEHDRRVASIPGLPSTGDLDQHLPLN